MITMLLVKQLTEDRYYKYISNLYAGMHALDYLVEQLSCWVNQDFEEYRLNLKGLFQLTVKRTETVPKSLRKCITLNENKDGISKLITVPCVELASPNLEPDETGAITLWYDIIELPSKRAERSFLRILDKYMDKKNDPYFIAKPTKPKKQPPKNGRYKARKTKRT